MAFDVTSTMRAIQSFLMARPEISRVNVGDPKSPYSEGGIGGAVFMDSNSVVMLMADGQPVEMHNIAVRFYSIDAFAGETLDEWELQLARAVSVVQQALWEDADLSGTIRNIDIAGEEGQPMAVQYGYVDVGGAMHRVANLIVPCKVDSDVKAAP
tara:strand:- start:2475 stop:2939 length:465 start_codon:yes stop_codon:yes gene_type:complete